MIGFQQLLVTHYSVHPLPMGHRVEMKECWSLEIAPRGNGVQRWNEPPKAAQVAGDRARISSQAGVHSRPKEGEAGPAMGSPTVVPVQYEFPEQSEMVTPSTAGLNLRGRPWASPSRGGGPEKRTLELASGRQERKWTCGEGMPGGGSGCKHIFCPWYV